ncbi:MAG: DNA helicase II [Gammaproteobacteria bacterium]|nr:MAG: DNA helicase II [Gammaproteobacteria bacterium]
MKNNDSAIEQLNESQQQAVLSEQKYNLILAGAGSGKTRVLTNRITHLLQSSITHPSAIFAVTFTNKAASEMKNRVFYQIGNRPPAMWIGTFHSLALRLLRTHSQAAKLNPDFQILDSQDQIRLVKRVIIDLNLNDKIYQPKFVANFINQNKENGKRSKDIKDFGDGNLTEYIKIYQKYEQICLRSGLVDFAEILLLASETLQNNPDLQEHYNQRFSHILIDEFQDTNKIQYNWIKQLAGKNSCVFAVGDDDQSIYGWRGAKIENILNFSHDFVGTKTTRLEQNYRSTSNILNAANSLIVKNTGRMGKNLWTKEGTGELIDLFVGMNELEEAEFVSNCIMEYRNDKDIAYQDIAILYRTNAQSRIFEEFFINRKIPYHIYGGLRFFEREEIKDALGYLRLISNKNEDVSFARIINRPTRGIGQKSLQQIQDYSAQNNLSFYQSLQQMLQDKNSHNFATKAYNSLQAFIIMIDNFTQLANKIPLSDLIRDMLNESSLLDLYLQDKTEKGKSKTDNLKEFVNTGLQIFMFDEEIPDTENQLQLFLNHISLEQGEKNKQKSDCVQMMSLHSAKGLEFPYVFMVGMEENIFPTSRSIDDNKKLEEERRLCYVGITRARLKLHLCLAQTRQLYGKTNYNIASRFIKEISETYVKQAMQSSDYDNCLSDDFSESSSEDAAPVSFDKSNLDYSLGSFVRHRKFGEGVVTEFAGSGAHKRVQVTFGTSVKWLVCQYARLIPETFE